MMLSNTRTAKSLLLMGKEDLLLPFIEDVVTAIDLDTGTAKVNLLEEI